MKENSEPEFVSTNETIKEVHHYHYDKPRYMRIFSALDLITLGIVLLLNTTGIISWKIWIELLRFWPLFIVSAGIGILFSFSNWSKVIGKILTYLIFLLMLSLSAINTITNSTFVDNLKKGLPDFLTSSWFVFNSDNNDLTKETSYSKKDYTEIKQMDLKLTNSKGTVNISDLNTDNTLFSISASYSKYDNEYTLDKTISNDKINLVFDSGKGTNGFLFFNNYAPKFDFRLGNYLQYSSLDLKQGAGDTDINLKSLSLDTLTANTGAGRLTAIFTKEALPASMNLEVGAGEMILTIPKDAGFRLKYSVGVGGVKIDGQNQTGGLGSNDSIVSDNYSTAWKKVDIKLNVGVGSFSLNFD